MTRLYRMAGSLWVCLLAAQGAAAAEPPSLSDMPKVFPKTYALWQASLPRSLTETPWIRHLSGVVSAIRTVSVDGRQWRFGTVCVPHDCGSNILGLLFSTQPDQVLAVAALTGNNDVPTLMILGGMSGRTVDCIRYLTDNYQATACP